MTQSLKRIFLGDWGLVVLFVAAFVSPLLLSGWLVSSKALTPDFSRLDPIKGFSNMFSLSGLAAHYCIARAFALADATIVTPMDYLRVPLIAFVGWLVYAEALDVVMRLFTEAEPITVASDWFTLTDAVLQLRPFQHPHPPVAVTSMALSSDSTPKIIATLIATAMLANRPNRP